MGCLEKLPLSAHFLHKKCTMCLLKSFILMENFVLELWGNPLPPLTNGRNVGKRFFDRINRINTELTEYKGYVSPPES